MKISHDGLEACDDCVIYIANGETLDEYPAEREAKIRKLWPEGSGGMVVGDPTTEFTWRKCELCGGLAGARHSVAILTEEESA
jgi:hypothetical protein